MSQLWSIMEKMLAVVEHRIYRKMDWMLMFDYTASPVAELNSVDSFLCGTRRSMFLQFQDCQRSWGET
jgi:hypothetical protein